MSTKRKLLVILYTGREGSSAIIETMRNSNEVYVPVFETFDEYMFSGKFPSTSLLSILSNIEVLKNTNDNFEPFYSDLYKESFTICFKWRPWGESNILDELSKIYDLHVILLARRNAIEHSLRHLASRLIYEKLPQHLQMITSPDLHLQFLKFDKHEKYNELITVINDIRIDILEDELMNALIDYCDSKIHLFDQHIFDKNDRKTKLIFFEDFVLNNNKIYADILNFINIEPFFIKKTYEKSDFILSNSINNYQRIFENKRMNEINKNYLERLYWSDLEERSKQSLDGLV